MASMDDTDLDDYFFCCLEVASTASLVALMEAEAGGLDNGPLGSGNILGLKYR